jgi:phage tail protein X
MRVLVSRDDMTVDLIVWQAIGRQDDRLVERTFELNPGLAALGPIVPVGTELELPDPAAERPPLRETVRLWG